VTAQQQEYGGYNRPDEGAENWDEPLNENFADIESDLQSLAERVAALGADEPDVGGYTQPSRGTEDWHQPLNENFQAIGDDVEAIAEQVEQLEN